MINFFFTFVMLGFFSFGGGYTFLPLMQSELVEKLHWLNHEQFLISLTAGQISPGPVAVAGSFAGFLVGWTKTHSFWGGLGYASLAWLGTNVATIICMGLIMRVYNKIAGHPAVKSILQFVMPVVIGLIFYLAVKMGLTGLVSLPQLAIAVIAFSLALGKKIDYAIIIISGGLIGYFFMK